MVVGDGKPKWSLHLVRFQQAGIGQVFNTNDVQLVKGAVTSGAIVNRHISVIVVANNGVTAASMVKC